MTFVLLAIAFASEPTSRTALARDCEAGTTDACVRLGLAHLAGKGARKDTERGFELLSDACAAGSGWGCQELAMHRGETYGRGEPDLVLTPAVRACGFGYRESCVLVARWAESTEASPLGAWDPRCEAGEAPACSAAGQFRALTGRPDELPRAYAQLVTACDAGEGSACRVAGSLLLQGDGVPRDEAAGLARLEAACADDDGWACSRLRDRARYALADATAAKAYADATCARLSCDAKLQPLPGRGVSAPAFPEGAAFGVCSVRVKVTDEAKVRWVLPVDCDVRLLGPVREALSTSTLTAQPTADAVYDQRWIFLAPGRVFLAEGPG
jgi:TPR repeat protein